VEVFSGGAEREGKDLKRKFEKFSFCDNFHINSATNAAIQLLVKLHKIHLATKSELSLALVCVWKLVGTRKRERGQFNVFLIEVLCFRKQKKNCP
jgi:hypothetical protein